MQYTTNIQNLKCSGCGNTVSKALTKIAGVSKVNVNETTSEVSFDAINQEAVEQVKAKLAAIGYPVVGEDNSKFQKAKSYVSCMIGKATS